MKSIALFVACVCACVVAATSVRAEGLRTAPAHPAPNQAFTIDLDYRTTCTGALVDPIRASVQQPGPAGNTVRIELESGIDCFELPGPSRTVHMTAVMPGIPAGNYPVYSVVSTYNGFDPPYQDRVLHGNVTIDAGLTSVPTLSPWALFLLAAAIGLMAMGVHARRNPENGPGFF